MVDDTVKIIGAVAGLINALAWPVVIGWLIWKSAPVIRDFLANISEGSVKAFGVEASAKRERATEAIARAELKKENPNIDQAQILRIPIGAGKTRRLASLVTSAIPDGAMKDKAILWVDDKPRDNLLEQQAIENFGADIDTVTSTEEALTALGKKSYDLIISDLKRGDDQAAGLKLLNELKARKIKIPIIFYTATTGPTLERQIISQGGLGLTNQATDLVLLVSEALGSESSASRAPHFAGWWKDAINPKHQR